MALLVAGLAESVGANELVDEYTEVITGVSLQSIEVKGTIKLHRSSSGTGLQPAP